MVQAGYDYSNWENQYIPKPEPTRQIRRIEKKQNKNKNAKKNVMIKVSVIIFAYAFLLVYLCIKSATLGYEIVSLENEIGKMETANHHMEFVIAQKTSLDIIEKRAIEELGMFSPGTEMSFAMATVTNEGIDNAALSTESTNNTIAEEKPLEKLYASLVLLTEKNNL